MPEFYTIFARKKFSPEFGGGGGIAPSAPFVTESIFSVIRNRKKYELHRLHLKFIISTVANSVWVRP